MRVRGSRAARLLCAGLLPLLLVGRMIAATPERAQRSAYVLPCRDVILNASYLGDVNGKGPGFLFQVENRTARPIRLEQPVPSSADWYARVGNQWLWRASAGRGGALVNAENPRGLMFAFRPAVPPSDPHYLTVPAHGSLRWTESIKDHPALAYEPGCPMCSYPGESQYQAVFSYAYLPNAEEPLQDLLRCGLRSAPVPMPPHPAASR